MAELPLPSRWGCWLVFAGGGLAAIWIVIAVMGTVIVRDSTGEVVSAVVVIGGGERVQSLLDLPGGYFIAVPTAEGTVEIVCRDGSRRQAGYVTGSFHTRLTVEPGCRLRGHP